MYVWFSTFPQNFPSAFTFTEIGFYAEKDVILHASEFSFTGMIAFNNTSANCNLSLNDCITALSPGEKELLLRESSVLSYKKGEMIIRQDFSASHLYLLESGLVTLNVFDDRRVSTVKLLTPQSFIGIMCSFAGRRLDFSATALQNSTIRLVEMDTFEQIIKTNGDFAYLFIRYISSLTNEMVHWIMRVKGRNVDGAIALILLEFSEIYQSTDFELPVTRKELASIIGYSKESVINTLSHFNKDNIIRINEKNVSILDSKRLTLISQAG
ncbi:MAG: hypothetical protein C0593_12560 [Marinilabiliales bacterium]|nr:MAG: hypothetical protein C0593_12560 [Marinilabiliales bacterium]